jgi:archaellum biogenesis ATPase FlaH
MEFIKEDDRSTQEYIVLVDAMTPILAIKIMYSTNALINEIQLIHRDINDKNKNVIIMWSPTHVYINGNERADCIAKLAARDNTLVIEDCIYKSDAIRLVIKNVWEKWSDVWATN